MKVRMRSASVIDKFAAMAKSQGELIAIEQGREQVSYSELLSRATRIAEQLAALEMRPKDVVAIYGAPSCGLYASILGVLLADGVMLLMDPRLPQERMRFMLKESGARHLISVSPGTQQNLPAWQTLEVDPVSALVLAARMGEHSLSSIPRMCGQYESPAYIFCTSGTTAQSRLVLGCHPGLAHFIQWQRETFQVGPRDRVAQLTGLSFDVVLRDIFLPLTSGATLCAPELGRTLAPSAVFPWLQAAGITRLHTVPTVAQSWLNLGPAGTNLPLMRTIFFAGEPLTDVLVGRWRERLTSQCEAVNLYGPTETTLAKFFYRVPEAGVKEGIQPVGAPLPGCELYILNEDLTECAPGVAGQISLATEYRSYGYLNAPQESARRFRTVRLNGRDVTVFLTGDLGKLSPSGQLHILGRIDNQVKINGIRVELEEISAVAAKHPGVASAVTVAFEPDGAGTKMLCLYWAPNRAAQSPSIATLRKYLATYLPEGVIPSILTQMESLPVTPNGKVDRSLLPAPRFLPAEPIPETDAEKQLLPIWKKVLRESGGVPGADFFSSGGTSLSVIELQLQMEESSGASVSAADIFRDPSFKSVARLIEQASGSRMQIPSAPLLEEYPLLPSQRAFLRFQYAEEGRTWSNVTRIAQFQCDVSADLMKQALRALVERHQNLRITFHSREGRWRQKLNQAGPVPLQEIDLRHMPSVERQLRLEQIQQQQSRTFLPPGQWPLFLATLVHFDESDARLVFTSSHLVSDALSYEIIARELDENIRRLRQGEAIRLPRLETEFLDYVMWRLGQPELNPKRESLGHWLETFSGYHERLELPRDGDPGAGANAAGYKRWFSRALSEQAGRLSAELNCSTFVVLFSAFAVALHRLSGRNTIVLKTVADGRPYSFQRKLVGNFATAVHVRSEIKSHTTFIEFTKAIQNGISQAVRHQECEFLEVLEALNIPVEADRIPLASIFLNPVEEESAEVPEEHEEHTDELGCELKADIMAYLRRTEPLIEIDMHYRKGLYSRQTISGLMDCLERALADMATAPANQITKVIEAVA